MATVVLTLEAACSSGGHARIGVTVNGADRGDYQIWVPDVLDNPFPDEAIENFIVGLIKIHKIGKTNAEVRNNLLAGLSITV